MFKKNYIYMRVIFMSNIKITIISVDRNKVTIKIMANNET